MFCHLFAIKPEQKSLIYDIFENKEKHRFSYEKYAETLEQLTRFNDQLKESTMENLFKIAASEEYLSDDKMRILKKISKIIDLSDRSFAKLKQQFTPNPINKKLIKYYDILGLSQDSDLTEIKARWKKLIVIYHPDKLSEASEKEIKVATKRMAEINLAYQEIIKAKRKK